MEYFGQCQSFVSLRNAFRYNYLQPTATLRNNRLQQPSGVCVMSIVIEGVTYFSATEVQDTLGIARQTLWRWRKASTIPQGRRYRGRHIVFSAEEVEEIREFSNRLEPVAAPTASRRKQ